MAKRKWTLEECKSYCLQFKADEYHLIKNNWLKSIIKKNGWQDVCYSHFNRKIIHYEMPSIEECKKIILDNGFTRSQLQKSKEYGWLYNKLKSKKLLDTVFGKSLTKKNYWTLERCKNYCLQFAPNEFTLMCHSNSTVPDKVRQECWEDICFAHFNIQRKHTMPSLEECKSIAKELGSRSKMQKSKEYGWLYRRLLLNKLVNKVFEDIDCNKTFYQRCIYLFTFPNNVVYIGLTYNYKKRIKEHLLYKDSSPVFKYIKETGIKPDIKMLHDYVYIEEAQQLEKQYIKDYADKGYTLLNKSKGGELGSKENKYSKESCIKKAQEYNKYGDFCLHNRGMLNYCIKNNFIDDIKAIFRTKNGVRSDKHVFTERELVETISKCKSVKQFRVEFQYHYTWCNNHNLQHLYSNLKKNGKNEDIDKRYSKEQCLQTMTRYKNISEFRLHKNGMYKYAERLGFIDEIMKYYISNGSERAGVHKLSEQDVVEVISKCKTQRELRTQHHNIYQWCCRYNKKYLFTKLPVY